jgi:multidrug resistance protein MdtO
MATAVQSVAASPSPLFWFGRFLKEELAPYAGRTSLVVRMVIAATVVMVISMTFQIPYGAYGALYALTISRENPQTTVKALKTIVIAFLVSGAYILVGATLFIGDPMLRLVWLIGSFFIMFFALSTMTNYSAAVRFGYLVIVTTPLWDQTIPTTQKVEGTLWAIWTLSIASVIAAALELFFAALRPGDNLVRSVAERLDVVEELLTRYTADLPIDKTSEKITRLSMVGMSGLRRILQRSYCSQAYREQMGAIIALVGRLIDSAANLTYLRTQLSDDSRERIRRLAVNIASVRVDLIRGRPPRLTHLADETEPSPSIPLLREMETMLSLIPEAFSGSPALSVFAPLGDEPRQTFLVPDALSNSEHVKFALKGCLAATLSYISYTSVAWPGLTTAVTTCFLTATTAIGASRQKQLMRVGGTLVGGVVAGMGGQVFILPYLDSIAGFTFFFLVLTIGAAWIATSSARLSYFGAQVATAFYLINLQEFKIQTSLEVARDRVVGLMLGLFMMWLVFDRLWGGSALMEMKKAVVSVIRLLAQFAREPISEDRKVAVERSFSLRETIDKKFDQVRALADAVLFEFGSSRQADLALRDRIRQWQPELRMLFVTRIALLKYRFNLPGFELAPSIRSAQQEFDNELGRTLDAMADRLDGKPTETFNFDDSAKHLEEAIDKYSSGLSLQPHTAELATFTALSRRVQSLTRSLEKEI